MPIQERIAFIKTAAVCFNCLREGHNSRNCRSSSCRKCSHFHNTLLHKDTESVDNTIQSNTIVKTLHSEDTKSRQVILATALMKVLDCSGQYQQIRVLLDSGSQATFISEACVQRLKLPRRKSSITITGLGSASIEPCKGTVFLQLSSAVTSFKQSTHAFILSKVTNNMPSVPINHQSLKENIINYNVQLADPHYHSPSCIDVLIGADIYYDLILPGKIKDTTSSLTLQNTTVGWIIAGTLTSTNPNNNYVSHLATENLSQQLQKIWEIEEIPNQQIDQQQNEAEQHFRTTYSRDSEGRFIVQLPFNSQFNLLGNSHSLARQRFLHLEKRLHANPQLLQDYIHFLKEYLDMNHMELIEQTSDVNTHSYYLPHHYVIRDQATSTKLRVVFDGSAQPATGLSLNQTLMTGPNIQEELTSIIMRFRIPNVVFTADISKMYRQVLVQPSQCNYQQIFWRSHPSDPLLEYRLKTVTYGTTSAPFLAIRCLKELANVGEAQYPLAIKVIKQDFYVDDVMSGGNNVKEASLIQDQLTKLLNEAGFELHKWTSNKTELLENIPLQQRNHKATLRIDEELTKTLGLHWHAQQDIFTFQCNQFNFSNLNDAQLTKRSVLSYTAKLFDPLGWVGPVVMIAKLVMQQLWLTGLGWDDPLPKEITNHWMNYYNHLPELSRIKLSRQMVLDSSVATYQLIGFCDASEQAYGAVVYIKSQNDKKTQVNLICSKSRVAPLKRISLPRLELCGAVLLARLINYVKTVLKIEDNIVAWTDSTIVLAWLNAHPHKWKTFVANRVTEIQHLLHPQHWNHVRSEQNPADCLTRGVLPHLIINHPLWWTGPSWLSLPENEWPKSKIVTPKTNLDAKLSTITNISCLAVPYIEPTLIDKLSSYTKLIRITAYCLRFIFNIRQTPCARRFGQLSVAELTTSENHWIMLVQAEQFSEEIKSYKKENKISQKSVLKSLCPFIDNQGLLRVQGRLQEAIISYNQKHPIIIPAHHRLTELMVLNYHQRYLHAGPQQLLAILRTKYWIIRAKNVIRRITHQCTICFRHRMSNTKQLMGNLPLNRVVPAKPFTKCGIDYAGPISVKTHRVRGSIRSAKAYVCIIVCFTTKAIHLELAGDLTAQSCLAALRRFLSRRGKPSDIYSDCGTNFIKTNKELKELYDTVRSHKYNDHISQALTQEGINWHFNPPASPHFGGLWEAGVKSTKYHLRRTLGLEVLTYEELYTLLTQIEACLNSRPLCPMSNDPQDLIPLTPGHFLIGESMASTPEPDLTKTSNNLLSRWQLGQKILQQFWKRWSTEYLGRLQQRPKWTVTSKNLKCGDLVLIKEDNFSPMHWPMARIIQIHPGKDGIVRTVTVKTKNSIIKRPILKCLALPQDN